MRETYMDALPGWNIVRTLGSGSYGKVYEIQKVSSLGGESRSALKVISIPPSAEDYGYYEESGYDDAAIMALFRQQLTQIDSEFSILEELKGNSHIVSYEDHDVVEREDGRGWDILIRMELLTSLPEHLKQVPLTEALVIQLGIDLCRALELCRKHGIIHRDIKPKNIFVNKDGYFKVGDFGLAKASGQMTRGTARMGTYTYMAPEVYYGKPYNEAVDIYSLGLVLYWLLNERKAPFLPRDGAIPTAAEMQAALDKRMVGETLSPPLHGSQQLKEAVLKACCWSAEDRYPSAQDLRADLEKARQLLEIEGEEEPVDEEHEEAMLETAVELSEETDLSVPPAMEVPEEPESLAQDEKRLAQEERKRREREEDEQVSRELRERIEQEEREYRALEAQGREKIAKRQEGTQTKKWLFVLGALALIVVIGLAVRFLEAEAVPPPDPLQAALTEMREAEAQILQLPEAGLVDLSFVRDYPEITVLNISQNAIEDIRPLEALTELRELDLSDNRIRDIGILNWSALKALCVLDLSGNPLENGNDAFTSGDMPALEILHLENSGLSTSNPLLSTMPSVAPNLVELYIHENPGLSREDVIALRQLFALAEHPITIYSDYTLADTLTFPQAEIVLTVGGTASGGLQIEPAEANGNLRFESTDETVATIDAAGTITAVKAGACYVRAFMDDRYAWTTIIVKAPTAVSTPTPTPTPVPVQNGSSGGNTTGGTTTSKPTKPPATRPDTTTTNGSNANTPTQPTAPTKPPTVTPTPPTNTKPPATESNSGSTGPQYGESDYGLDVQP